MLFTNICIFILGLTDSQENDHGTDDEDNSYSEFGNISVTPRGKIITVICYFLYKKIIFKRLQTTVLLLFGAVMTGASWNGIVIGINL